MMKKNMKKKSTARKLLPAAGMLAVSASMLATSTYAWFTMNKEVTVTGMEVKTRVGENLLIAADTLTSTAKLGDSSFKTSDVDTLAAWLEPVSTINGKNFYYTDSFNVGGSGDALSDAYLAYNESVSFDNTSNAKKTKYDSAFMRNYGTTISESNAISANNVMYGYVDYVFQLKANNTSGGAKSLNVTDIKLTNGSSDTNSLQAFRTAIFVEAYNGSAFTGDAGTLVTILSNETGTTGANYFENGKAVKDDDETDSVSNLNTAATLASVSAGSTSYYKVVVRLWIEGEDENCNNTVFNTQEDKWSLDLTIKLEDNATNSVAKLNTQATATKTNIAVGTTVTADAPIVLDGVSYYAITGTSTLYKVGNTAVANTDRIYRIDTVGGTKHPFDVTNTINFTAGG